ncbi:hypothetical protein F4678DRAFT_452702 [Xylaria arbuscula]|nr:hypothetical protein F4678DRAFT_452702 [Xylaria arbuscula]
MTTPTTRATPRQEPTDWVPLNEWNQVAPRSYNRFLLCFGVDNHRQAAAISHLKSCAMKLGEHKPVLKSLLKVDTAIAHMSCDVRCNIPVEVHDIRQTLKKTYAHLKETGFPASNFVDRVFHVPADNVAHALIIRIYTIDGGLLLGIHLHHSIGDGKAVDNVITWFSAETRGGTYHDESAWIESPFSHPYWSDENFWDQVPDRSCLDPEYVSQKFPERRLLTSPAAQEVVDRKWIGKIFVFTTDTLSVIRSHIQKLEGVGRPSTSVMLIALLWAHTIKARTAHSSVVNAATLTHDERTKDDADDSKLLTVVDARSRVFSEYAACRYFGNAAEVVLAKFPTADLMKACKGPTSETSLDMLAEHLEPILRSVQDSIETVDRDSVAERQRLFTHVADPRKLVFNYSADDTRAFIFNSWRYLGMNVGQEWNITGTDGVGYPDALRRASGEWNSPAAVFLPAQPGSGELEVMITIEEGAMELLLKDESLMALVTRVIG